MTTACLRVAGTCALLAFAACDRADPGGPSTGDDDPPPTNRAPVADDLAVAAVEDQPVTAMLRASDLDGDALTFELVAPPAAGTAVLDGARLTYTPDRDAHGDDQLTFVARDATATSNVATVHIAVASVNDPPTLAGASLTGAAGLRIAGQLRSADVDGDALDHRVVVGSAHGALVELDPTTGRYVYAPERDFVGSDTITFAASDGTASTSADVHIDLVAAQFGATWRAHGSEFDLPCADYLFPITHSATRLAVAARTVDCMRDGTRFRGTISGFDLELSDDGTLRFAGTPAGTLTASSFDATFHEPQFNGTIHVAMAPSDQPATYAFTMTWLVGSSLLVDSRLLLTR